MDQRPPIPPPDPAPVPPYAPSPESHLHPTQPGSTASGDATRLLDRVNAGDHEAMSDLLPLVYEELRSLASGFLSRERVDHTLQPTALVHEAYMKLIDQRRAKWESRGHFMAIAATAMRRILVNHARDRHRLKRGGHGARHTLGDDATAIPRGGSPNPRTDFDLIALDEALEKLAAIDPRKVRIVEARFFVGLTIEEAALLIGVSTSTVRREWEFARAWLLREMDGEG